MPTQDLESNFGVVNRTSAGLVLSVTVPQSVTLGSARRVELTRRRMIRVLRRARPIQLRIDASGVSATFGADDENLAKTILAELEATLTAMKTDRLHPRIVEESLGITGRERIRWTKDGRLQQSGTGAFGVGRRSVHFALYAFSPIAALTRTPQVIEDWRRADEKHIDRRGRTNDAG